MLRIGLAGCGWHALGDHAPALARCAAESAGKVELAAACDLDAGRARAACRDFGFRTAYESLDAMLRAERLDGCVCVLPEPAIVPTAVALLERGLPCTIEKPLGSSPQQAQRLAEAARRTGTPHMVSMDRRFNPWLRRAAEWCRQRGPVRYVLASMIRPGRREGGFIPRTAVHAVDAMRHLAGEVERFDATVRPEPELTGRWVHVDFAFRGGVLGRLDVLTTAGMCEERYELYGEGFRAAASVPIGSRASLRCWQGGRTVVADQTPPGTPQFVTSGAYAETAHFLRGLGGKALAPTVEDVLPSMSICFEIDGRSGPAGADR